MRAALRAARIIKSVICSDVSCKWKFKDYICMTEKLTSMKLSNWAAIAEIVSSVAVVITLTFLFFEIQNNTQVIKRESLLSRSNVDSQFFIDNPRLSTILSKIKQTDTEFMNPEPLAFQHAYNLTYEEADLWVRYLTLEWSNRQATFLYGTESDRELLEIGYLPGALQSPDEKLYWDLAKDNGWYQKDFVNFVNSVRDSMDD
ncbi:MAG: hypothetical protein COB20_11135 [SAR86 cluster bacterium]|uniref:Uncharacterized protein n=1 Tax=SAR86 cluster bacterium TaxID=2030880 RepID=A0A2A4X0K7_9GAMM|nr:MAG: hypothetical protein COB20_11135 [SAR86 cluster bacterium]